VSEKEKKTKGKKKTEELPPPPPAGHADDSGCIGCRYHDPEPTAIGTCNFCYITGKPRGCPVEGCTRKSIGEKAVLNSRVAPPEKSMPWAPIAAFPGARDERKENPWEQPDARWSGFRRADAWELYLQGKNDREIAKAVGVTPHTIHYWRKRHGLKPQGKIGRPKHGAE
jgi:hypothetical protein